MVNKEDITDDDCSAYQFEDENKNIENNPLNNFVKILCIVKESYLGKSWNGNDVKNMFKNLHLLTDFVLPKDLHPLVACLKSLKLLNKAVCGKTLDPDYDNIIDNFVSSYRIIHSKFAVSLSN